MTLQLGGGQKMGIKLGYVAGQLTVKSLDGGGQAEAVGWTMRTVAEGNSTPPCACSCFLLVCRRAVTSAGEWEWPVWPGRSGLIND